MDRNMRLETQSEAKMAYRTDITVRENIMAKIEMHKREIAELEKSMEQLGPLLDMRIDFLTQAVMVGR